jgi:hypothetical protein
MAGLEQAGDCSDLVGAYQASVSRESSGNLVLPFRGLAESIIASETGFC